MIYLLETTINTLEEMSMSTKLVHFSHDQLPKINAMGSISLSLKRLHQDQVSDLNYLIYVTNGHFYVVEDEQTFEVTKGMCFFRAANTHAYGKTFMQPGTSWYWISFTTPDGPCPLPKQIKSIHYLDDYAHLGNMYQLYMSHKPYKMEHLNTELQSFFYRLLDSHNHTQQSSDPLVTQVDDFIKQSLDQNFDADNIARHLQLNYSYIGKRYKAEKGMTINQFYSKLKVQKAIQYLEEGSMNISGISDKLGYPNPYYFSRVFKKVTGLSPKEYGKQMYFTN